MLTLSNVNTYTGATTISAGTLVAGAAGLGTGTGRVNVASGATLWLNSGTNFGQSPTGLSAIYSNMITSVTGGVNTGGASSPWQTAFYESPTLAGVQSAVQPADAGGLHHAGDINYTGTTFPAPYNTNNKTFFDSYYSGMIDLTTSGSYTFVNNGTDDTMAIYVDGQQVLAGTTTASQAWTVHNTQTVSLAAGMHSIAVVYFQGFGGYSLGARIAGPNISGTADIGSAGTPQVTPDLVVGSLSGSGNVVLSTGNLSTGFDNTSATYSGAISGIGGVNKWGTGTQTLAGSNSYTGITSVMGGVLSFANSSPSVWATTI